MIRLFACPSALALVASMPLHAQDVPETQIMLDAADTGREFEGIGAVSAGASSRHLIDFPEKQKNEVLDFLFKPKYGANLQHLKVEIGGGENSTCGSEPSHAITKDEISNPKARGYELWLMSEARKRNPKIFLDCLPWSFPGWITQRFSQDSADWFVAFLDVAKKQYGLDIDWIAAAHNEAGTDVKWITQVLRPALDRKGYQKVKLQAPDHDSGYWQIFDQIGKDPALDTALHAVGYHYVSAWYPNIEDESRAVPEKVKAIGKPLWASEDFTHSGQTWEKSILLGQLMNKFYIRDRITKTQIWCPFDSILPGFKFSGTGLMHATQSWSGHYAVWPAVWVTAHTTQFADPGWKYMDKACAKFSPKTWKGSYVALRNPNSKDWSMVFCTFADEKVSIKIADNLSQKTVYVWKSDKNEQFIELQPLTVSNGEVALKMDKDCVYTLTTTTGQKKGATKDIPASKAFPFPYVDNFEGYKAGETPKYLSDQKGTFETARRDSGGICLKQICPTPGIMWNRKVRKPHTVWGDDAWTNYSVQGQVMVQKGSAEMGGRYDYDDHMNMSLVVTDDGKWSLQAQILIESQVSGKVVKNKVDKIYANGDIENFKSGSWLDLKISFVGQKVLAYINGKLVGQAEDFSRKNGMAFISSSYDPNAFDDLSVAPLTPEEEAMIPKEMNIKSVKVSSQNEAYKAEFVSDKNDKTFWHTEWKGDRPIYPHEVILESTEVVSMQSISFLPRQDGPSAGGVKDVEVQASVDGQYWEPVIKGSLSHSKELKILKCPKVKAKWVKIICTAPQAMGDKDASFAEISCYVN